MKYKISYFFKNKTYTKDECETYEINCTSIENDFILLSPILVYFDKHVRLMHGVDTSELVIIKIELI